jgi:hypothetical protein
MISLVAPVGSVKSKYAINLRKNIEELYPNRDEVEIVIYENPNVYSAAFITLMKDYYL